MNYFSEVLHCCQTTDASEQHLNGLPDVLGKLCHSVLFGSTAIRSKGFSTVISASEGSAHISAALVHFKIYSLSLRNSRFRRLVSSPFTETYTLPVPEHF